MNDTIEANEYTMVQLKEWLSMLELPTNGSKSALVARLNEVPAIERGECPVVENEKGEKFSGEMQAIRK